MTLHSLIKTLFYRAGFSIKKLKASNRERSMGQQGVAKSPLDIMSHLHTCNPYDGFDFEGIPYDPHGWGSTSPIFRTLLEEKRPRLVIEVGTWKGASAIHMSGILRDLGLPTQIVCVDTWLGALEFWNRHESPERYDALKLVHGFPSVYYDFLANVCHAGHQDRIVPFPQTASCAALWMRSKGVFADFIYLDASHEEEDVYEDIQNYWEVLEPGGILLGDDWPWDGVRMATQRFAREQRLSIQRFEEKWYLTKGS